MTAEIFLLHILGKDLLELILRLIPDPLIQDISIGIQQVKTGADAKAKIVSKVGVQWVADFQVRDRKSVV